mmetsp:Transcript_106545/g.306396  ORF Transcript_106545/g.306396 Transcript_106545/m.306396 type:complete len:256 (-) Transcript_106545:1781-2548(-)
MVRRSPRTHRRPPARTAPGPRMRRSFASASSATATQSSGARPPSSGRFWRAPEQAAAPRATTTSARRSSTSCGLPMTSAGSRAPSANRRAPAPRLRTTPSTARPRSQAGGRPGEAASPGRCRHRCARSRSPPWGPSTATPRTSPRARPGCGGRREAAPPLFPCRAWTTNPRHRPRPRAVSVRTTVRTPPRSRSRRPPPTLRRARTALTAYKVPMARRRRRRGATAAEAARNLPLVVHPPAPRGRWPRRRARSPSA